MNSLDLEYSELLHDIIHFGIEKKDRTGVGTKSIFGRQIRHNMKNGFPLITTKKMYFKGIVTELLWFLRGDTNIKYLIDNDCHIWDGDAYKNYEKEWLKENPPFSNPPYFEDDLMTQAMFVDKIKNNADFADKWGDLGPIYGAGWRRWTGKISPLVDYNHIVQGVEVEEIDQIQNLINDLKKNPDSRRLMVNAWNVAEIDKMVLPPCHYGFQIYTRELTWEEQVQWVMKNTNVEMENFYITEEVYKESTPKRAISLMWNQRSVDTFLGLPFNIASYGLLLEILGEIVNMVPEELIGNLGDTHLYLNHIEQATEQMNRSSFDLPKLYINSEFWYPGTNDGCGMGPGTYGDNFDSIIKTISISDFEVENYQSHDSIKAKLNN
jgi:thymidylate synthase